MKIKEYEQFYLREFEEDDWQAIHEYASQEVVSQYQPWGPNTEEETRTYLKGIMEDLRRTPRFRYAYAIVLKENNKLIGAAELIIKDFHNKEAEIGYILNPLYWGRGLAVRAAEALLEIGFKELNLHRIAATCASGNIASQRVLEKSGLTREGLIREHLKMKDGWRDSFLYSILEHEWRKGKGQGEK